MPGQLGQVTSSPVEPAGVGASGSAQPAGQNTGASQAAGAGAAVDKSGVNANSVGGASSAANVQTGAPTQLAEGKLWAVAASVAVDRRHKFNNRRFAGAVFPEDRLLAQLSPQVELKLAEHQRLGAHNEANRATHRPTIRRVSSAPPRCWSKGNLAWGSQGSCSQEGGQCAAGIECDDPRATGIDRRCKWAGIGGLRARGDYYRHSLPHKEQELKVANMLAPLIDRPANDLLAEFVRPESGFAYIARRVPFLSRKRLRIRRLRVSTSSPEFKRVYPRKWLGSQVLGMVGADGNGLLGLEHSLNSKLRGEDGERRLVNDARRRPIALRETRTMTPGAKVKLTLDASLQEHAENVLSKLGSEYRPKGATAIVMDPKDSSIKAIANWPRVDANTLGDAPEYARQNRAIGATLKPGPRLRPSPSQPLLEDRKITPETTFDLPPTIHVADREIHEAYPRRPIALTTAGILRHSSNVGAIT